MCIRDSLSAAGACTGEFEERFLKLTAFDGLLVGRICLNGKACCIFPVLSFCHVVLKGLHSKSLFLGRTYSSASYAACAVESGNLNAVCEVLIALHTCLCGKRSLGGFFFRKKEGTDCCMR